MRQNSQVVCDTVCDRTQSRRINTEQWLQTHGWYRCSGVHAALSLSFIHREAEEGRQEVDLTKIETVDRKEESDQSERRNGFKRNVETVATTTKKKDVS